MVCLTSLELISDLEIKELREEVEAITNNVNLHEKTMSIILGGILAKRCGLSALKNAVNLLTPEIMYSEELAGRRAKSASNIDHKLNEFKMKYIEKNKDEVTRNEH